MVCVLSKYDGIALEIDNYQAEAGLWPAESRSIRHRKQRVCNCRRSFTTIVRFCRKASRTRDGHIGVTVGQGDGLGLAARVSGKARPCAHPGHGGNPRQSPDTGRRRRPGGDGGCCWCLQSAPGSLSRSGRRPELPPPRRRAAEWITRRRRPVQRLSTAPPRHCRPARPRRPMPPPRGIPGWRTCCPVIRA